MIVFRCDACGAESEVAVNPGADKAITFHSPEGWFCRWNARKESEEIACSESCVATLARDSIERDRPMIGGE